MTVTLSHVVRPLTTPVILIGAYVVLVTLTKDLQQIWPLNIASANWRFGALGFLLGSGALPVVGFCLIVIAAVLGSRVGLAKVTGIVAVALGVGMLVGLVVFLVDARTLLTAAAGDAESMLRGATRRTTILGLFSGGAYVVLGLAGLRIAGNLGGAPSQGRDAGLVVGK